MIERQQDSKLGRSGSWLDYWCQGESNIVKSHKWSKTRLPRLALPKTYNIWTKCIHFKATRLTLDKDHLFAMYNYMSYYQVGKLLSSIDRLSSNSPKSTRQTDGQTCCKMNRQINGWKLKIMGTHRQTDKETYKWTDRQKNRCKLEHISVWKKLKTSYFFGGPM